MTIYAVNGKEPIAAWIPSLDTAGNGTTTLTDLVGSNNGTLTNMDAATDWVADTDAGGIRALDFDGTDDYVDCGAFVTSSTITFSFWVKKSASGNNVNAGIIYDDVADIGLRTNLENNLRLRTTAGGTLYTIDSSFPNAIWTHYAVVCSGTTMTSYKNGSSLGSQTIVAFAGFSNLNIGWLVGATADRFFGGSLDDIRIFDQALDASDIAYLYNSGNGRGITATTPNTRRRRYTGGYGL